MNTIKNKAVSIVQEASKNTKKISSKELLSYYENQAEEMPLFGSLREISLAENVIAAFPLSFQSVIDVGSGEGFLLAEIRKKYPSATITGFDISKKRLLQTKQHVPTALLARGDVLKLPFQDNSFDVVVCSELLEHIDAYQAVAEELFRIAKKQIIITVPYEQELITVTCPKCQAHHYLDGHVNTFTEKKLRSLLETKQNISAKTKKFHSIYTYNRLTLKLPLFLRLFFESVVLRFHTTITFLKPNYLLMSIEKRQSSERIPYEKI